MNKTERRVRERLTTAHLNLVSALASLSSAIEFNEARARNETLNHCLDLLNEVQSLLAVELEETENR